MLVPSVPPVPPRTFEFGRCCEMDGPMSIVRLPCPPWRASALRDSFSCPVFACFAPTLPGCAIRFHPTSITAGPRKLPEPEPGAGSHALPALLPARMAVASRNRAQMECPESGPFATTADTTQTPPTFHITPLTNWPGHFEVPMLGPRQHRRAYRTFRPSARGSALANRLRPP